MSFFGLDPAGIIASIGGALESLAPAPAQGGGFSPAADQGGGFTPAPAVAGSNLWPTITMPGQGLTPAQFNLGTFQPSGGDYGGFAPSQQGYGGFEPSGGYGGSPFQPSPFNPLAPPPAPATTPGVPGTTGGATGGTGAVGAWGAHEPYRAIIEKYAAANGIDPDAVAAFLRIETPNGNPNARSPAGAMGLGQVMPFHFKPGEDPYDPDTNLRVSIAYFAEQYKRFGSYQAAAAAYLGGPGGIGPDGKPRNDNSDGNVTSQGYAELWERYYQEIKATAPKPASGASIPPGPALQTLFGGTVPPLMQEFGHTDYSEAHPDTYAYGNAYGLEGSQHPGVDYGMPRGTRLYIPVSGTVQIVGGNYYTDNQGGTGELMIQLANGDQVILGHMASTGLRVGQQVNAGDFAGLSGGSDGDHLHLEVRRRNANGSYTIIDPRLYFGGR